jgi:hypothetical protein|tara:strand:- start:370 stop:624 length:255 start_codon:yes stop_codon:yes gene_type:complete
MGEQSPIFHFMTRARFDPRLIDIYKEPRLLLHFQWGNDNKIYRYALVEKIDIGSINELTKQKKDELNLSNEDIWKKYGISSRHL